MSDRLEQINKTLKNLEETDRIASENFAKAVEGLDPHSEEYRDKLMLMAESDNMRLKIRKNLRDEREKIIKHEKEILDKSSITIPLEEYNRLQTELKYYKGIEEVTSQISKEIVNSFSFDEKLFEKLKADTYFDISSFTLHVQIRPKSFI